MKKLVLHLGLQKTGSTSLQETFLYNPQPLSDAGYGYANVAWPDDKRNSNHSFPLIVAFSDGWQTSPEIVRRGWNADGLKRHFTSAIRQALTTDQNLIMSGEDITDVPEAGLRAFSALVAEMGFDLQPVMFVRSPLEFVTSMTQTRVRHGLGYHVFKAGKSKKVEMCQTIWPGLRAIAFQDAIRHPEGPLGALTEACGLPSARNFKLIRQNESMSEYATRIIGHVNTVIPLIQQDKVNPLRTYLDTELLAGITGPKFQLTRSEFTAIRSFIQGENAAFDTLLGPSFCDPSFGFQDTPHTWTAEALAELSVAMRTLSDPLQASIRDYFTSTPDVSAAERALAFRILA